MTWLQASLRIRGQEQRCYAKEEWDYRTLINRLLVVLKTYLFKVYLTVEILRKLDQHTRHKLEGIFLPNVHGPK